MSAAVVLPGLLVALGLALCVAAFRPRHARLADALGVLAQADDRTPQLAATGLDRIGAWWVRTRSLAVPPALERQLTLRGRTVSGHYTRKVLCAAAGFALPLLAVAGVWIATGEWLALPALLSLVLAALGFLAPDLALRGSAGPASEDATESLLTFFDLVILERLANQSATQSLHAAASVSDAPVFLSIRTALERAHLQQRSPYGDLKALGHELDLPALSDLADVMRLDESGASLSGTLRARVRELRDAHLTRTKLAAAEVSERMTLWMVIPSLTFGLFFLLPPLLTMLGEG